MQLRRGAGQVVVLGLVVVYGAACGGGGGGTTPPDPPTGYYSDVVGIGFSDSPRKVAIGQWPSWFAADELVAGCTTGQSFYLDECWDDEELNLDTGTVTFSKGASSAVLQIGAPLPAGIGDMKERAHGQTGSYDEGWQDWAVIENTGPGYIEVVYDAGLFQIANSLGIWGGLWVFNGPARSRNEPWAVHGAVDTVNGLLTGLVVKTDVLFGIEALDATGVQCRVVHDWTPDGRLIVAGKRLAFPTTLEAVAAAVGQPITLGGLVPEENSDYVKVTDTLWVRSEDVVNERRTACGETDVALLTNHRVTSITWRTPPSH